MAMPDERSELNVMTTTASEAGERIAGTPDSLNARVHRTACRARQYAQTVSPSAGPNSQPQPEVRPSAAISGLRPPRSAGGRCRHHHELHSRWQAGGFVDAGPIRQHVPGASMPGSAWWAIHCVTGADHRAPPTWIVGGVETGTWPQGHSIRHRRPSDPRHPVPVRPPMRALRCPPWVQSVGCAPWSPWGHTPKSLGANLSMALGVVRELLEDSHASIDTDTARRVTALFDELHMQPVAQPGLPRPGCRARLAAALGLG